MMEIDLITRNSK